jgi:hypothetical protein
LSHLHFPAGLAKVCEQILADPPLMPGWQVGKVGQPTGGILCSS